MTLDTETIKRMAVEAGVEQDGYYQSIDDSSAYTYRFTEPQLLAFANSIAKLTTELNELDEVFSVDKVDAERLSYMLKHGARVGIFTVNGVTKYRLEANGFVSDWADTKREAIDAAMKESESK